MTSDPNVDIPQQTGETRFFLVLLGLAVELNGTIFLQVFIFLSLLVWLSKTLFAPIMRLFEEREQRIDGAKKIAFDLSELADDKARVFAIEYEKAKVEARHTLSELKHAMEKQHEEALDKVKAASREKLLAAEIELREQERVIREDLQKKSEGIAKDMVAAMMRPSA